MPVSDAAGVDKATSDNATSDNATSDNATGVDQNASTDEGGEKDEEEEEAWSLSGLSNF